MALDKKDLKSIEKIVDKRAGKAETKFRGELHQEIGFVCLEMNQRFEKMDKKMDNNQKVILEKIEDIQVVYQDVEAIKKKLRLKTT